MDRTGRMADIVMSHRATIEVLELLCTEVGAKRIYNNLTSLGQYVVGTRANDEYGRRSG